jgi:hypothetical protein
MSKRTKIIISVVILAAAALFVVSHIMDWHDKVVRREITQEQKKWQTQSDQLEQKVSKLEDELAATRQETEPVPSEKVSEALGKLPPKKQGDQEAVSSFKDVETQVAAFFSYLDQQDYVAAYNFEGGTYYQFRQSVNLLSVKSPVVAGETDNLFRLMTNIAYFYRTLGKERVRLVNDVLRNESEIIEPVMGTFYNWFTMTPNDSPKLQGRPSFKDLYEISGFFLNTLAGRSYLFRRDPKVRTLTRYYCVLILDEANDRKINGYGIDIRPHIDGLYEEVKSTIGLANRRQYIARLDQLAEKYNLN